jgi:adenylate kinase family enzyme
MNGKETTEPFRDARAEVRRGPRDVFHGDLDKPARLESAILVLARNKHPSRFDSGMEAIYPVHDSERWAMSRIHIVGASGSGTSTLGAALAARLGHPHVDADALFWMTTEPPFTTRRPAEERHALLLQSLPVTGQWVFSGSALKRAASLEPVYDLIVFLRLDPSARMERLRRRQAARYGARLEAGGDMAVATADFPRWAEAYDTAGPEQRSPVLHEEWLASQTAPVMRLDSSAPVEDLVAVVLLSSSQGVDSSARSQIRIDASLTNAR